MAAVKMTRNQDGSVSYGIQVRVKPFKPAYQSFPTRAEAIAWSKELTEKLRSSRGRASVRPELTKATLATLNAEYLADPNTKKLGDFEDRERQIKWWTEHHGTVKVTQFGVTEIREARTTLLKTRAEGTVNRYLAAQRRAWNWAKDAGFVLSAPWPTGIMLDEPDARTRFLSDEELVRLLNAAKADSAVMYVLIIMAIATGPRVSELLRTTWRDVDEAQNSLQLPKTKTVNRSVHLPQYALDALLVLKPENVEPDAKVFVDTEGKWMNNHRVDMRWRKIRAAAKLEDFVWHDLRHTCASFLAAHGANLAEIGSVLGHKSAQTTLKYTHWVAGKPVTGHAGLNAKLAAADKKAAEVPAP